MQEDFKSIRRLRYPLPEVVNPETSVCIEVHVPNDIAYISAFWGQMFALTRWYAWMGDTDHTAKDVAAVWRGVYEAAQEENCMDYIVRQHPFNSCELQRSFDNGETWETWADLYSCATGAAQDIFGSQSDNGASHSQPGEQPGGEFPAPGQCFDLDLTVNGNSMLLIPLAITSGWTLELTSVKGAWNDGNIGHDWVCPNGHAFFLGACSPLVEATNGADPIPTLPHMQLIIRLPDGTYDEIPQDGTQYTIPPGMPDGNTFLLANDSELGDNQGSVSLHLLACSANCVSTDSFDFLGSETRDWFPQDLGGGLFRGHISDSGWRSTGDGSNALLRIGYIWGSAVDIQSITVKGNNSSGVNNVYQGFYWNQSNPAGDVDRQWSPPHQPEDYEVTIQLNITGITELWLDAGVTGYSGDINTIQRIDICYAS